MEIKEVILPELGEGINEVEVSDILVNIVDEIKTDDPIILLETEKASMEIPSTNNGIITEILIKKGDIISKDDVILRLNSKSSINVEEKPIIMEKENNNIEYQKKNKRRTFK